MKYLLFALILFLAFGQLGRFEFQSIVVHLNDLFVFGLLLIWLVKTKGKSIKNDPLTKPLALFVGAMFLSTIFNPFKFPAFLYLVRFVAYAGLYFVAKDQIGDRKIILKLMEIAILGVAVVGILQFVFVPDVSSLKALDWDDHYYRLISTFLDPGFTGAMLVLGLILAVLERSRIQAVILYVAMALTYSRASYLMYLFSFATISFFKNSVKIFLIALIILVITIPLLPKSTGEGTKLNRENSVTARLNNWNKSIEVWETKPVFGIGFNSYRYAVNVSPQSHSGGADNSLLLVLATTGVVGFAAYIFLLKKTWDMGDLLFRASLVGIIVHSMFNNTLFYPWVMEWLWILLALSATKNYNKKK